MWIVRIANKDWFVRKWDRKWNETNTWAPKLGPPQTREIVIDNYLYSTTKMSRQL